MLKKFEDRDDALMGLGMVIIEARLSSEIGVVDDESSFNLVCLEDKETYKNVQIFDSLTTEQQTYAMKLLEES